MFSLQTEAWEIQEKIFPSMYTEDEIILCLTSQNAFPFSLFQNPSIKGIDFAGIDRIMNLSRAMGLNPMLSANSSIHQ